MKYDPQKIEKKWHKKWLEEKVYQAKEDSGKPKYYQLETFPYPSAAGLHVGHPKGYIAEDIHARFKRMNGHEVLYTMGWDAFGLPTENYAIKVGKTPKEVAAENIKNFKNQVRMFGLSYDWDREINTSSPEYYKWTQWLFIELFKSGLAYRAKAKVNWCPKDNTVLANEQVINGRCERDGELVVQKEMEQWFLKITNYAERLLTDLKGLDWPEATIKRQEDWIGKSEGAFITFPIKDSGLNVEVFTTRPDTLFGATYMVLAPEHPLIQKVLSIVENPKEIQDYIEQASHKTELMRQEETKDKTGVEIKGVKAINPATQKEIPIWIADYVLGSYGTGAIMAVPAHDERDFDFAQKFNLQVVNVIDPVFIQTTEPGAYKKDEPTIESEGIIAIIKHWSEDKYIALKWKMVEWTTFLTGGIDDGLSVQETAIKEIKEETGYMHPKFIKELGRVYGLFYHVPKKENRLALGHIVYIELENGEKNEISKEESENHDILWLTLDEIKKLLTPPTHIYAADVFQNKSTVYTGSGKLINSGKFDGMDSEMAKWEITKFVGGEKKTQYKLRDWSISRQRYWGVPIPMIHCQKCGIIPVPEEDLPVLLPDDVDYRPKGMPPLASSKRFMEVKCPNCSGKATRDPETLDTFVDSSWYYLRYTDPNNKEHFADKAKLNYWMPVDLYVIGAEHTVLHLLYSRFITKFLHDKNYTNFTEPFLKLRHVGLIQGDDGQKMSKSRGNVVNPDEVVEKYGADSVRLYEMFMGPFENGQPWNTNGLIGTYRFLARLWSYFIEVINSPDFKSAKTPDSIAPTINKAIKKVGHDITDFKFNTAVACLMSLLNDLYQNDKATIISKADAENIIKIISPFVPHISQEFWHMLNNNTYLDYEPWPKFDDSLFANENVNIAIQINGKTRGIITTQAGTPEEEIKKIVQDDPKISKYLEGQAIQKTFFVQDRLINFLL